MEKGGMSLKGSIKKAVISLALLRRACGNATVNVPRVFLYHRFCEEFTDTPHRVSADVFRWQLEQVVKYFRVRSFAECLEYYQRFNKWPERTVVVTIDDGYRDFYEHAYPQLKALSLPATFFVTVNFVDQKIWLWPDRLDYALRRTMKKRFTLTLNQEAHDFILAGSEGLFLVWKRLSDYCIASTDVEKTRLISQLETILEVDVPQIPTKNYAAVNWDELSEMAANGIEIGCHTMNHPILSKIQPDQLTNEIADARSILESKLKRPVRTFCYPNGQPGDINEQVVNTVRDSGYLGAPYWFDLLRWDPFRVPRICVSSDKTDFLAKLIGVEFLGQKLKSVMGRKYV